MLGLYVHVPFCSAICNYCTFNRGLYDEALKKRYVEAVVAEIAAKATGEPADTIFFGGGTPSLLADRDVAAIIGACRSAFALAADAEITLEANPESATAPALSGFRRAGVNRLSLGVQSFRDDELRRLSRLHSADRASAALRDARRAGYDNVSLDLMMGLPGQTPAEWHDSVQALVSASPDHASLYMLEVYPNSPLAVEMRTRGWPAAPDDDVADMYLAAMGALDGAGYEQYEISNVARPGRAARHNLKYWQDGEWLGFGPGAHGTYQGVRTRNVAETSAYVEAALTGAPVEAERRAPTPGERLEEALFTGLRLSRGVDIGVIGARYGVDVWQTFGTDLTPFVECGWLDYDSGRRNLRLTRSGMLMAHEVMTVFVRATAAG